MEVLMATLSQNETPIFKRCNIRQDLNLVSPTVSSQICPPLKNKVSFWLAPRQASVRVDGYGSIRPMPYFSEQLPRRSSGDFREMGIKKAAGDSPAASLNG
jgi:hypothetical protein